MRIFPDLVGKGTVFDFLRLSKICIELALLVASVEGRGCGRTLPFSVSLKTENGLSTRSRKLMLFSNLVKKVSYQSCCESIMQKYATPMHQPKFKIQLQ